MNVSFTLFSPLHLIVIFFYPQYYFKANNFHCNNIFNNIHLPICTNKQLGYVQDWRFTGQNATLISHLSCCILNKV